MCNVNQCALSYAMNSRKLSFLSKYRSRYLNFSQDTHEHPCAMTVATVEATNILSTLSKCTQALFASREDIERGEAVTDVGAEWRWNDISCKSPDKLIGALRQLKRMVVTESDSVSTFREEQRDQSLDARGKAPNFSAKNADSDYQNKAHRSVYHFLHKCGVLKAEVFPILEVCSTELSLAHAEGEQFAGEIKVERCAAIQRNALRLLVALTSLLSEASCEAEERKTIATNSLLTLITTANLCAVLRHASTLLIQGLSASLSENDYEVVDMTFLFLVNLAAIVCFDSVPLTIKRRFTESFSDSGGIEFIVLFIKKNCERQQTLDSATTWNMHIVSILANIFQLIKTPAQWSIIAQEISTASHFDSEISAIENDGNSPTLEQAKDSTPVTQPAYAARSRAKPLLARSSGNDGPLFLCEHGTEKKLARLNEMDQKKRQKYQKGAKRVVNSDTAPTLQKPEGAGQAVAMHMLHQFDRIIGKLMDAFLDNCFFEWITSFWPLIYRWSTLADDGTERVEEKEALAHDDPCPPFVSDTFTVLGSVIEAIRENILYIGSQSASGMLPIEDVEKLFALRDRYEAILQAFFGIGAETSATHLSDMVEAHSTIEPSKVRPLVKIIPTGLKVASAVHKRKHRPAMYATIRFLFQSLRAAVTFSHLVPEKWYHVMIYDSGLWTKAESFLHQASTSLASITPGYLAMLLPFVHVCILLMGKHDALEGESSAIIAIASNPQNMWPYFAALEHWAVNSQEANRAIQYLMFQMLTLRCQGPLLNIHLLYILHDIVTKSATAGIQMGQEMRNFALVLIRAVVSAIKATGPTAALPRMLFTLSSSSWHEVTTVASAVAEHTERESSVMNPVEEDGEGNVVEKQIEPAVVRNRDQSLRREAKRKLRPPTLKKKKEPLRAHKKKQCSQAGDIEGLDGPEDDLSSTVGSSASSDEATEAYANEDEVLARLSSIIDGWKQSLE